MLVDDPELTLKALCDVKDSSINKTIYTRSYEKRLGRKKPIHPKTSDTHFYLLKIFDLIKPVKQNQYITTESTNKICESFVQGNDKYKQELRAVIKNSEKNELFEKFLNHFQNNKLTVEDLLEKSFTKPQLKTLLNWSVYVGFLDTDGDKYWKIKTVEHKPTFEQFKKIFLDTYKKLNQTNIFMLKKIYIYVHEIRNTVCAELEISKKTFDLLLTELIESNELKIRLHGSPPIFTVSQQELKAFHYRRKIYHYLSIE